MSYNIISYVRPNGSCPFNEYQDSLHSAGDKKGSATLDVYCNKLSELGSYPLAQIRWTEKLTDDIWELRPGKHRVFYFWDSSRRTYVLLSAFRKKTAKTPAKELRQAEVLRAEYLAQQSEVQQDD